MTALCDKSFNMTSMLYRQLVDILFISDLFDMTIEFSLYPYPIKLTTVSLANQGFIPLVLDLTYYCCLYLTYMLNLST